VIAPGVFAVLLAAVSTGAEPVTVRLWDGDNPVNGELVEFGSQGVKLRVDDAVMPETIAWYRVREVEGAEHARARLALEAWRAHSRLARGDRTAALPVYTGLGEEYLWRVGPQSQDVCMGLTRCLLGAGERVEAVAPSLAWFVAADMHGPRADIPDIEGIDGRYAIYIDLPPVFLREDGRREIGSLPESDTVTARERYLHAGFAAALSGREQDLARFDRAKREPGVRDPGVELFEDMIHAQSHPEPARRRAARDALERRTRTGGGSWIEVWARLGLGKAMLGDDETQTRERGLIELIHIIVRLPRVRPELTLLAAELAREYLNATDRPRWGAELMLEARSGISGLREAQEHPANE